MAKILFLGNLGVVEIVLIALIVLLLFGGRKIPELMKGIGRGIRSFKEGARGDGEEPKQKEISPWEEKYNSEHDARLRLAAEYDNFRKRTTKEKEQSYGNGKADDEWYELAGSEYGKTGERRNLKMVYTRPDNVTPSDGMVEWVSYAINESETGTYCYAKAPWGTFSVWPAWLMESAEGTALTYTGCTMLPPLAKAPEDLTNGWPTQASRWYDYGYVCNSDPTDETGSSFDIGWARDKEGNKVNLPGIDFVKIQNATLQDLGYGYGPACVLFNCAIDLHLAGKEIETIAQ